MNGLESIARVIIFVILFYYMVVLWSLAPLFNPKMEILLTVEGYFFSGIPVGWVRIALLSARGLLGLGISLYVLIPAFRYLFEFEPRPWANSALIMFSLAGVGSFFLAVILQVSGY